MLKKFSRIIKVIYIIILILNFYLLCINFNSYIKTLDCIKENYKNSFIYVKSDYSLDFDDERIVNVLDVFSDGYFYYLINDELNDNEIIIPEYLKKDGVDKDSIVTESYTYEFDISGYYSNPPYTPIKYVNSSMLNKIKTNSKYEYCLIIDDWNDRESIVSYYDSTFENLYINSFQINSSNVDYISQKIEYKNLCFLYLSVEAILLVLAVVYVLFNKKD